jgi:DNA-directed RNA polymerase III subunit RPC11
MFCPNCENILISEKYDNGMSLNCKSCPYIYEITKKLVKKQKNQTKELEKVFGGENELKYASVCSKQCIKCNCNTAMFMELQTRSADEPMTIFYQCIECRTTWKE